VFSGQLDDPEAFRAARELITVLRDYLAYLERLIRAAEARFGTRSLEVLVRDRHMEPREGVGVEIRVGDRALHSTTDPHGVARIAVPDVDAVDIVVGGSRSVHSIRNASGAVPRIVIVR
jgi:hypothetical protein